MSRHAAALARAGGAADYQIGIRITAAALYGGGRTTVVTSIGAESERPPILETEEVRRG